MSIANGEKLRPARASVRKSSGHLAELNALAHLLRPYRVRWLLGVAGVCIAAGASLGVAWLAKIAVDDGIEAGDKTIVAWVASGIVGVVLLAWGARWLRFYYMYWTADRLAASLQGQIFEHIQRLPMSFYESTNVGTLISRLTNDVETTRTLFNSGLTRLIKSLVILIGGVVLMFILDWKMAALTLSVIPILVMMTTVYRRLVAPRFLHVRDALAHVTAYAQWSLCWMSFIQSYNQESRHIEEFSAVNDENRAAQMSTIRLGSIYYPSTQFLSALAKGLLIIYGGLQVSAGEVSTGAMVAFFGVLTAFFTPLTSLSQVFQTYESGIAAVDKIFGVLHEEPRPDSSNETVVPRDGHVEVDNISFTHIGGPTVFRGLSLDIEPGKNVAFLGTQGGGKTTLAHLLLRLHNVDSGEIRIGGVNILEMQKATLRRHVGYVGSRPDLVAGTLRENVASIDPVVSDEELTELIDRVAGHGFLERFPQGLDTHITFAASNISDGELLVLGLIRALVFDPEVLIIDSATDGLDTLTAEKVQSALEGIRSSRTVLIITERAEVLESVDEVIVLDGGKVTARGRHQDLVRSNPKYREMIFG